jgi:hypothetical protein
MKQYFTGDNAYLIKKHYDLDYTFDDKYFQKTIQQKVTNKKLTCFVHPITREISFAGDMELQDYFLNELAHQVSIKEPPKFSIEVIKYPYPEDLKWVRYCTLNTVGKATFKNPSEDWIKRLVEAEHSPIRELTFGIKMEIPYWVSVHFTRHHIGVNHYVQTQRSDRTGVPRERLPQGELVSHVMSINAQELINMAHKRLCKQASPETRAVMKEIVKQVVQVAPYMKDVLVPMCVYRNGKCTEMFSCKKVEE